MKNTVAAIMVMGALLAGCATPGPGPTPAPTPAEVAVEPTATAPATGTPIPSATPTITPGNDACVRATTEIPEGQNPTHFLNYGPPSGCYDSVGAFLDDIGLTWEEFVPGTVITFWTLCPADHLGRVVCPTPTPTPIPPTPTPRPWQEYRMEYAIRIGGVSKLWMPVPREWDGVGMTAVSVVDISPPPTDRYQDPNGNEIAFWQIENQNPRTYRVVFYVMVQPIYYDIEPGNIGAYDASASLYQRFTQPSSWVQSHHPEIIQQAHRIVGTETNAYIQAQLLHTWVAANIEGGPTQDALATLHTRTGSCAGHSALLVALLRAVGIPARPVSGLHTAYEGAFHSGSCKPSTSPSVSPDCTVYQHTWVEFFLPEHGWIQCDASAGLRNFAKINEPRVVLSRGDVIELGSGYALEPLFWFHAPHSDVLTGSTPPTQTWGEELTLTVQRSG